MLANPEMVIACKSGRVAVHFLICLVESLLVNRNVADWINELNRIPVYFPAAFHRPSPEWQC